MDRRGGQLMTRQAHLHVAVLAVSLLAGRSPAFAQSASKPARFTIGVSGGIQQAAEDVSDHFSFPKNVETETIDVKYPRQPWGLIDLGASYRIWKNLGVGVAVTATSGTGKAEVTASVPHPFFFNQPRIVSGTDNDIAHSETGVHLQLQYLVPATGHLHFVLEGG